MQVSSNVTVQRSRYHPVRRLGDIHLQTTTTITTTVCCSGQFPGQSVPESQTILDGEGDGAGDNCSSYNVQSSGHFSDAASLWPTIDCIYHQDSVAPY